MALTKEDVLKIADLARLEVSEDECQKFAGQLSSILSYVDKLNALDVASIEPMAHAVLVPTPLRKDVAVQDQTLERSLSNAPDREDSFFKVPRVI